MDSPDGDPVRALSTASGSGPPCTDHAEESRRDRYVTDGLPWSAEAPGEGLERPDGRRVRGDRKRPAGVRGCLASVR